MKLLKAVFATFIFALTNSANADTYYFQQDGFDYGAYVSGSFSGSDLNGDGLLSGTEVTDFNMRFSGGAVEAFVMDVFSYSVTYDFDGVIDTDNEGIYAIGNSFNYTGEYSDGIPDSSGWGEVNKDNDIFSYSTSFITVTTSPVPEPSTYALMLAGLGLVGFMARRRKQA